jgi:hypothetical protein
VALQGRAGQQAFVAARFAAEAEAAFAFVQVVVAPLARQAVEAIEDVAIHHQPAAHAGAQNHSKHHFGVRKLLFHHAQAGFGQGKAVGIVGHLHADAEQLFQVGLHGLAVEAAGVAVFEQAGARHQCARRGHPQAGGAVAHRVFHVANQLFYLAQHVFVAVLGPSG